MVQDTLTLAVDAVPDDAPPLVELGKHMEIVAGALQHALDTEIEERGVFPTPAMVDRAKALEARIPRLKHPPLVRARRKQVGQTHLDGGGRFVTHDEWSHAQVCRHPR